MPATLPLPALLAELCATHSDEVLASAARQIAQLAVHAKHPRKSIAAVLRHHAPPGSSDEFLSRVTAASMDALESLKAAAARPAASPMPGRAWLSLDQAAAVLGLGSRTLKSQLVKGTYRRLYGWPWWDGHCWRFPASALDPDLRAAHMATVPALEPHPDLLPPWCER